MSHSHSHPLPRPHADRGAAGKEDRTDEWRLALAALANLCMAGIAAWGGWRSGSLALWSDAGHLLADLGGIGLVLLALRYGRKAPGPRYSYGHRRLEVFAAGANALLLMLIAGIICWEAVHRFTAPAPIARSDIMLAAAGLNAAGNFASALLLWRSRARIGVKAALLDMLADGCASLGVLLAAALIRYGGLAWPDAVVSLLIAALILFTAVRLLADAAHHLLDAVPAGIRLDEVRAALQQTPGVLSVHDLHVWLLAPGIPAASAHIRHNTADPDELLGRLLLLLAERFAIAHPTLQLERNPGCPEPRH